MTSPRGRWQRPAESTATIEKYIKAIYLLGEGGARVTGIQLAQRTGVSAPTVSATIARLARVGLLVPKVRGAYLTQRGRKLAEDLLCRHHLLERWLFEVLGVDWAHVHAEACALEHALTPAVVERMAAMVGSCETCPHGNPLPGRCAASPQPVIPLARAATDCEIVLDRIAEGAEDDSLLLEYLHRERLLPGVRLRVVSASPSVGTLIVSHCAGSRRDEVVANEGASRSTVLGLEAAAKMMVRVIGAATDGPTCSQADRLLVSEPALL